MTAVTTTTIPPAASAQGQSITAAYSYTAASSTYLLVTLATFPTLFSSLGLDSLVSNQNRNCRGFTVSLPGLSCLPAVAACQLCRDGSSGSGNATEVSPFPSELLYEMIHC